MAVSEPRLFNEAHVLRKSPALEVGFLNRADDFLNSSNLVGIMKDAGNEMLRQSALDYDVSHNAA